MRKNFFCLTAILLMIFTIAGCGRTNSNPFVTGQYYNPSASQEADNQEDVEEKEVSAESDSIPSDLYLIISNDMAAESFILQQLASGRQYLYYYSLTTTFLDKYGDRTSVVAFESGKIVNIGAKDTKGKLKEVKISDAVWEYPDITKYSVDTDENILKIADTKYAYDRNTFVVSDGNEINISSLTSLDEISVIGIGRKILSISVTTGHGKIKLENTEIFDGSYIQIGSKIFAEVTPNMEMEIPEGTYTVTVANDGYGGSKEIEIVRDDTTVINLDELKGEGPKKGLILFAIDVLDAVLEIDGKEVDYSEPLELQYGVHSLNVIAEGYDDYSKKLFVNSKEATILIELTDDGSSSSGSSSTASDNAETSEGETTSNNNTGSNIQNGTTGNSSTVNNNTQTENSTDSADDDPEDPTTDYLSTLSELLTSLTN